jgi:hypothetical protein
MTSDRDIDRRFANVWIAIHKLEDNTDRHIQENIKVTTRLEERVDGLRAHLATRLTWWVTGATVVGGLVVTLVQRLFIH